MFSCALIIRLRRLSRGAIRLIKPVIKAKDESDTLRLLLDVGLLDTGWIAGSISESLSARLAVMLVRRVGDKIDEVVLGVDFFGVDADFFDEDGFPAPLWAGTNTLGADSLDDVNERFMLIRCIRYDATRANECSLVAPIRYAVTADVREITRVI